MFMLALCAAIILRFGRWRRLTAIFTLGISFVILLVFVTPVALNGALGYGFGSGESVYLTISLEKVNVGDVSPASSAARSMSSTVWP